MTVDDAFRSPQEPWRPVSPKLVTARRLVLLLVWVPVTAAVLLGLTLAQLSPIWLGLAGVVALVVLAWSWWLIGRRVRSYGYAERKDDLLVTSGILFRRLTVVPYGRMQLVDVAAGPIDRNFAVTTVKLHTAAATTDATIPGLPPEEASALRDRLAAMGEQRGAGL